MKFSTLLHHYFRQIRFSALITALMFTVTIFISVITNAKIRYLDREYSVVNSCTLENAYYFERLYMISEIAGQPDRLHLEVAEAIEKYRDNPVVEHIYTTQTANTFFYGEERISIVLCDPELLKAFPALRELGYNFSSEPDGCVLGSKIFNRSSGSKYLELKAGSSNVQLLSFAINGHISAPYKHMAFTKSGTSANAHHLFADGQCIIVQATDNVMSQLADVAQIQYDSNYIIDFADNATSEQIEEILNDLNAKGKAYSIDELTEQAKTELLATLKESIPQPAFLLLATIVSSLSTQLLLIRKKGKELSVYYLCGLSKRRCSALAFCANCLIAFPAFVLNSFFIILAPHYDWLETINLPGMTITHEDFIIVFGCYLLTVAISGLATFFSMRRHTPLTYLRGVEL